MVKKKVRGTLEPEKQTNYLNDHPSNDYQKSLKTSEAPIEVGSNNTLHQIKDSIDQKTLPNPWLQFEKKNSKVTTNRFQPSSSKYEGAFPSFSPKASKAKHPWTEEKSSNSTKFQELEETQNEGGSAQKKLSFDDSNYSPAKRSPFDLDSEDFPILNQNPNEKIKPSSMGLLNEDEASNYDQKTSEGTMDYSTTILSSDDNEEVKDDFPDDQLWSNKSVFENLSTPSEESNKHRKRIEEILERLKNINKQMSSKYFDTRNREPIECGNKLYSSSHKNSKTCVKPAHARKHIFEFESLESCEVLNKKYVPGALEAYRDKIPDSFTFSKQQASENNKNSLKGTIQINTMFKNNEALNIILYIFYSLPEKDRKECKKYGNQGSERRCYKLSKDEIFKGLKKLGLREYFFYMKYHIFYEARISEEGTPVKHLIEKEIRRVIIIEAQASGKKDEENKPEMVVFTCYPQKKDSL